MRLFAVLTALYCLAFSALARADSKDWMCETLKNKAVYDTNADLKDFKYMIPGKGNWIFETSNDLKQDYSIHPDSLKFIEKITAVFKSYGIDLLIIQMPTRGITHANQFPDNINAYAEKGPFDPAIALESYTKSTPLYNAQAKVHLVNIPDITIGEPFYYATDLHWNSYGARRMAHAVADYIQKNNLGKGLIKGDYETRFANKIPYKKAYPQLIEKVCNTTVPPEDAEIYETAKISSDLSSDSLFADLYPQIVLIGTSFSLQQNAAANFQGFLEEFIKTDILNMSIAGGGDETAILSYIRLGDYKKGKTKIAIWEIPGHYKLNLPTFVSSFEQIYASLSADCTDPIARGSVTISNRSKILFDAEARPLPHGQDYALRLSYNAPVLPNVTYVYRTQSKDGQIKRYKREIKWPPVAGKHPSFLTTLDVKDDERLLAVTYRGDKSLDGLQVEGTLCRLGSTGP